MIPKTIHYCWFGRNPLPELAKKCIASWQKYCPNYQIIEWNEDNFDLNTNAYIKEAYEAKKWAFVTDYVRLFVMVKYGGIYMDTDVEVTKPLDIFLTEKAFSGFETPQSIPTGIMACEKGFPLFEDLLKDYDIKHFKREDGSYDTTTNVYAITKHCLDRGLVLNNKKQTIVGFTLYPNDYFCPKDVQSEIIFSTSNTYTIHHFSGSWNSPREKKWKSFEKRVCRFKNGKELINSTPIRIIHLIYISGLKGVKWKLIEIRRNKKA